MLAGLQLLQPQPCGEKVARVGVVPDCRQAHYLSLAKRGGGWGKEAHYTKKHFKRERAFICCLTLRRVPIAFHIAACTSTHHSCHKLTLRRQRRSVAWVCPCFEASRIRSEVFAEERNTDLKAMPLWLGLDEPSRRSLKGTYGCLTQHKTEQRLSFMSQPRSINIFPHFNAGKGIFEMWNVVSRRVARSFKCWCVWTSGSDVCSLRANGVGKTGSFRSHLFMNSLRIDRHCSYCAVPTVFTYYL